jgi:serine/threonine-protein kinase RsbW
VRVETTVVARAESLAAVRAFVERACAEAGADPRATSDLTLAVDEACANIIEHGYAGRDDGAIAIACEDENGMLRVTLTDRGRSFSAEDIPRADTTSGWQERPVGGLGWHLIRRSVDDVDYRPDPVRGNRLTLVKRLPDRA